MTGLRDAFALVAPDADAAARALVASLVSAFERLDLRSDLLALPLETAAALALEPAQERRAVLLLAALLIAERRGSTRLAMDGEELDELVSELLRDADLDPEAEGAALREALAADGLGGLVGPPESGSPLVLRGERLLARRLDDLEGRVASALRERLEAPAANLEDAAELRRGPLPAPNPEQREAVARALRCRLLAVTGGPGTGKTTLVVELLRQAARRGLDANSVALAAPTGRAAYRLGESLRSAWELLGRPEDEDRILAGSAPRTLHRLLGYSPASGRWSRHANHPLGADLVVVDEASMIDLELFDRLLDALRPEARLLLLGDADQLPSVACGAVFRDLVSTGPAATLRLERSHRLASEDPEAAAVLEAAAAVRRGDAEALLRGEPALLRRAAAAADLRHRGAEFLALGSAGGLGDFLDRWLDDRLALRDRAPGCFGPDAAPDDAAAATLLARHLAHRLLTVTRVQSGGAEEIDAALHRRHARQLGRDPEQPFLPGEPVMITANDHARELWNGDLGVLVPAPEPGRPERLVAVFARGDEIRRFELGSLRARLERAWAGTVHKAQGSECEEVALVLPARSSALATREIVYTAMTRCRRSAIVLGEEGSLAAAVVRTARRDTGLRERMDD